MEMAYKIAILIALVILVTGAIVYWEPRMILCVPALAFFSFFCSKTKKPQKLDFPICISRNFPIVHYLVVLQAAGCDGNQRNKGTRERS